MNELNQVNSANLFLILRRYLEKEKILLVEEKEREDKYLEDVSFFGGEQKLRTKRRKIFGGRKYFFVEKKKNGEGIGGTNSPTV